LKLNSLLIFNQFLYEFIYLREFVIIDLLLTQSMYIEHLV